MRRSVLAGSVLSWFGALFVVVSVGEAGVLGSPHDFSGTGYWTRSSVLAPGGVCSACHLPHGAQDGVLWARSLSGYRNRLTQADGDPRSSERNFLPGSTLQCYDCHDNHGMADFESPSTPALNLFNSSHKPQNLLFGFTKTGPGNMTEYGPGPQTGKTLPGYYETDPPGSASSYGVDPSAPLARSGGHYFRQDPLGVTGNAIDNGDKLPCSDCHDPHAWNSDGTWQAFIRRDWPAGSTVAARLGTTFLASSRMANDPPPGSARSDVASRSICTACHGTSDGTQSVFFNEINPGYRNDARVVRPPATVAEHGNASQGACNPCHGHNTIPANCKTCHGFPPSDTASPKYPASPVSTFVPVPDPGVNDSHARHFGAKSDQPPNSASVYSFPCGVCHYGALGPGAGALNQHLNGLASVVIDGAYTKAPNGPGGAYDNTNYYNPDYGYGSPGLTGQLDNTHGSGGWGEGTRSGGNTCRNVYCHSAGRRQASMQLDCTVDYRRPAWNSGPLPCNGCHGSGTLSGAPEYGMPNYPNGGVGTDNANSHGAHVADARIECSSCHAGTVTGTGSGRAVVSAVPTLHVNTLREVSFPPAIGGTYDNASKTCSGTYCHGPSPSPLPRWGDSLGCGACHANQGATTGTASQTGAHHPHSSSLDLRIGCETCHAGRASAHANAVHAGGPDNAALPYKTAEVRYTDNGAAQVYDTRVFLSRALWVNPFDNSAVTPAYTGGAAAAGSDPVNANITWTAGTCGTVWCHSNARPLGWKGTGGTNVYRTPVWTNACIACHNAHPPPGVPQTFAICTRCHSGRGPAASMSGTDNLSRAHVTHAATDRYGFTCDECHAWTVSNDGIYALAAVTGYDNHVDGIKTVRFGTTLKTTAIDQSGGSYDNAAYRCYNTYCHSNGTDNVAFGPPVDNAISWNSATGGTCATCHGGNGASAHPIATGSHAKHVATYNCSVCHSLTVAAASDNALNASTGYANHVNGAKTVAPGDGYTFAYAPGTPGSCSGISCHGGGDATWGGTIGCDACHGGTADADNYGYGDNVLAKVRTAGGWDSTGHGRLTGSGSYASGNPAANDGTRFGPGGSPNCVNFCHFDNAAVAPHTDNNSGSNYFRLATGMGGSGRTGITQATANDVCNQCHTTGGSYQGQATRKVVTAHFGSRHDNSTLTGGYFCWDCHDPHGDGNDYMMQDRVAARSDKASGGGVGIGLPLSTAAASFTKAGGDNASSYEWADYVKPSYDGLCQVCHNAGVNHFNAVSGYDNAHNRSSRCTACHGEGYKHGAEFAASCDKCHGDVNGAVRGDKSMYPPNGPVAGVGSWPSGQVSWSERVTVNASRGDHLRHAGTYGRNCDRCHTSLPGADAAHATGKTSATMSGMAAHGSWNAGALPGNQSVTDDSCANVSCHSPYSPENPNNAYMSGTPFAYSRIWIDNVLWDCYTCHAYDGTTPTANPRISQINTGSHVKHMSGMYTLPYHCEECHPSPAYTVNHKNGVVDWNFGGGTVNRYGNTGSYSVSNAGPTDNNAGAGHRAYGNCSNVYCHSTVQSDPPGGSPTYSNPTWGNSATGLCGTCHRTGPGDSMFGGGPSIATGSHLVHVSSANYRIACVTCHSDDAASDGCAQCHGFNGPTTHADGKVQVQMGVTWYYDYYNAVRIPLNAALTVFDNTGTHGSGTDDALAIPGADNTYGRCWGGANLYCHSDGNGGVPLVNPAAWGDNSVRTVDCTYCHGGGRTSTSPIATGSHAKHVASFRCSACHSLTAAAAGDNVLHASTGYASHVNGAKDVVQGDGYTFTYSAGPPGSCSSISCHGGNGATWGGSSLGCGLCHVGTGDRDDFGIAFWSDSIVSIIDNTQWMYSGHGATSASKPSGTYDASLHPVAAFGGGNPCLYCHDDTVPHGSGAAPGNPFRLKDQTGVSGYGSVTPGWNATCLVCHSKTTVPPGYNYPGGPGAVVASAGARVDTAHYGSKHVDTSKGGRFCHDCHDPHGDRSGSGGNIFMIQDNVTVATDNDAGYGRPTSTAQTVFTDNSTGDSYARSSAPFNGVCNVCHTTVGHYTRTSGDGHQSGVRCVNCHDHDVNFEAKCIDCHADANKLDPSAPTVVWRSGNRPSPPAGVTQGAYGSHLVALKSEPAFGGSTDWNAQCNKCHSGHGGTVQVPMPPTSWTDPSGRLTGTNMAQRLGLDNYAVDNGIRLGGTATSGTAEADLCWNCHSNVANNVSEWGFNTKTTPTGYPVILNTTPANFPTQHDGTADRVNSGHIYTDNSCTTRTSDWTAGYWMEEYDNTIRRRIASVHSASLDAAGQSSSVASNVDGSGWVNRTSPVLESKAHIRCSYCHDVHDLNKGQNDAATGKPFLRGSWVGNPYPPELPPRRTYSYPTGAPRNGLNQQRGGYFLDQNSNWPTNNPAMNTLALTAGLCVLCHGTNVDTMDYYTGSSLWRAGMVNGHSNSTLGGTRSNARDIFDAGRGSGYGMAMQEYAGSAPCLGWNLYACAPWCPCAIVGNIGWYGSDYSNWYTAGGIGGAQGAGSMAHKFTCSKCHTPHAAGLPALLTHNCIDAVLGTPVNNPLDDRAANCHRKTTATDGWHKLAPGQ